MRGHFEYGDIAVGDLVGHRQPDLPGKEDELATVKVANDKGVICTLKDTMVRHLEADDFYLSYDQITFMDGSLNHKRMNTYLVRFRIKTKKGWQAETITRPGINPDYVDTTLVKELLAKGVEKENIRIDRNVDITDMAEKAIQAIKDSLDNKTIG